MAASAFPAVIDEIRLSASKTRRDLRLSLGLLIAGIVISVSFYGYIFWVSSSGGSGLPVWSSFVISSLASAGSVLILVGAIFAVINWSLLRKEYAAK